MKKTHKSESISNCKLDMGETVVLHLHAPYFIKYSNHNSLFPFGSTNFTLFLVSLRRQQAEPVVNAIKWKNTAKFYGSI